MGEEEEEAGEKEDKRAGQESQEQELLPKEKTSTSYTNLQDTDGSTQRER